MEIWIAAYLSHSGCVREWCCPGHMALPTPVCPTGMFCCPHSVRCNPQHTSEQLCASPGWGWGCAHMEHKRMEYTLQWDTSEWTVWVSSCEVQDTWLSRVCNTPNMAFEVCISQKELTPFWHLKHTEIWEYGLLAESVLQSDSQHVGSVESPRFLRLGVMEGSQRWARVSASHGYCIFFQIGRAKLNRLPINPDGKGMAFH